MLKIPEDHDHPKASSSWLEAFRQGDRRVLEKLYFENVAMIRQMLQHGFFVSEGSSKRFTGIRSYFALDCAVQEVFRRAFDHTARKSFDERVSFSAYLRGIARNYAFNSLRDREIAVDPEVLMLKVDDVACDERHKPDDLLEQKELRETITQFKNSCSAEEKAVITFRYEEGLSQSRTAARLHWTRRHVRTIEANLRRRLVKLLKDYKPKKG